MKRLDRANLLQRLLAVEPGTARRDISGLESCTLIRNSWLYTFNGEIACAIGTALEKDITGAVSSQTLITYLKALGDSVIEVGRDNDGWLQINARGEQVVLPLNTDELATKRFIERVDKVPPDGWLRLDKDFAEAVSRVMKCARKPRNNRADRFSMQQECIHIAPNWLEASDNRRLARYEVTTPLSTPILVRASTLKEMIPLGFTQAAITPRWLHFRNPLGLRMSVRHYEPESYPNLDEVLAYRGRRITLPGGLGAAARRVGLFAPIGIDGRMLEVRCSKDGMELSGSGAGSGGCNTVRALPNFNGPPLRFRVAAELLAELADDNAGSSIEVSEATLRYKSGPYTYLTSLETINGETRD